MCTAITYKNADSYFGRNLDLEYSYRESVTITPRNYVFNFRKMPPIKSHYAIIGMAYVAGEYPLYYDAANEHGLAMAGLNFPGNAVYYEECDGKPNIASFELIPWILSGCKTIADVKSLLLETNILNISFSEELPPSPLHWIIADKESAITLEAMADGVHIYDNDIGVLTNNPPFDFMKNYLATFRSLSPNECDAKFANDVNMPNFCRGMAAIGLPGDSSSPSRFVRAAFNKLNSISSPDEESSVNQFFHILSSVEMVRGAVRLADGNADITIYSSAINQSRGIYYYTTYDRRAISAVDMWKENLDGNALISYPIETSAEILKIN